MQQRERLMVQREQLEQQQRRRRQQEHAHGVLERRDVRMAGQEQRAGVGNILVSIN